VFLPSAVTKPRSSTANGLLHGELALLLPDAEDGLDLGTLYLPALPAVGAPIEPGVPAESGGATLTLPSDGVVTLEAFAPYDTPENQAFRAAELPPARFPGRARPRRGARARVHARAARRRALPAPPRCRCRTRPTGSRGRQSSSCCRASASGSSRATNRSRLRRMAAVRDGRRQRRRGDADAQPRAACRSSRTSECGDGEATLG
jgi:hypothetical protein